MIGAGTVVTKDVPDYALVVGNPGKVAGWVSEAGKELTFDSKGYAICSRTQKKYKLIDNKVTEVE